MKSKFRWQWDGWIGLLRGGLLLGFDLAVLFFQRKKTSRQEAAIFCLHGLGDLLLAGNAIERLANHFRSRNLRTVLFVHSSRVEFARRCFAVDSVEGIDRHRFTRKLKYRAAVLKAVANRFAIAVQPTYNRMLRVEDSLVRATGAPEKVGSAGHAPFISAPERLLGNRFYTNLIAARPEPMHELERYAEFMAGLELPVSSEPWRAKRNGYLPEVKNLPESPYLVIAPKASAARRSWPLENFLQAARQIAIQRKWTVVLTGNKKIPAPILWPGGNNQNPELIDLCGQISTENLPDILSRAELILSNDSGTFHLGVSLNRPTVAVGGSGLPARYFPYPREETLPVKSVYQPVPCAGCNWRCIHTTTREETAWCLQQISWPEVAAAAEKLLQRHIKT